MSKCVLMVVLLLSGCAASQPATRETTDEMLSRDRPYADGVEQMASRSASIHRIAVSHHDRRWILEAVAERMGVQLHPAVPVPEILFESATALQHMQTAAERQWGFRPQVFTNAYLAAENRIYLIDDANFYSKNNRTLDDALAHEFVHYLQARYLKDSFKSEWSEAEALSVQDWFRKEYMAPILTVTAAD